MYPSGLSTIGGLLGGETLDLRFPRSVVLFSDKLSTPELETVVVEEGSDILKHLDNERFR